MTVDEMAREIVRREGGFVDDPSDKGGATKYGVSLRYAKGIGLDLDGDQDTDIADIEAVTPGIAAELFKRDFFTGPKINLLPEALHPVMFDFAVNSGAARAIISLQETLSRASAAAPDVLTYGALKPDGAIGTKTVRACEEAYQEMNGYLVNAVCDAREAFLKRLVERDPSQGRFLKGWLRRAREFRVEVA